MRAESPHCRRRDGRIVQGDRATLAGLASARGICMTVRFRDACPEDAVALDCLFRTVFCETFAHLNRAEDLAAFLAQFTEQAWRAELMDPDHALQLAEEDGAPVGYVKLGPLRLPVDEDRSAIFLSQLYVLQQHHGAGIGQGLIDW